MSCDVVCTDLTKLSGRRRKYAWQALMKPLPFCRSPSKLGGGEGFKSFFVFVTVATGRGAGVAATGEFCCVTLWGSHYLIANYFYFNLLNQYL